MIEDINTNSQFRFIYSRSPKLVIAFYRQHDDKSTEILQTLSRLSFLKKYSSVNFLSVDFDIFEQLAESFNVYDPPFVSYVINNKIVREIDGAYLGQIEDAMEEMIN
jgi:hypothetical protein